MDCVTGRNQKVPVELNALSSLSESAVVEVVMRVKPIHPHSNVTNRYEPGEGWSEGGRGTDAMRLHCCCRQRNDNF